MGNKTWSKADIVNAAGFVSPTERSAALVAEQAQIRKTNYRNARLSTMAATLQAALDILQDSTLRKSVLEKRHAAIGALNALNGGKPLLPHHVEFLIQISDATALQIAALVDAHKDLESVLGPERAKLITKNLKEMRRDAYLRSRRKAD